MDKMYADAKVIVLDTIFDEEADLTALSKMRNLSEAETFYLKQNFFYMKILKSVNKLK